MQFLFIIFAIRVKLGCYLDIAEHFDIAKHVNIKKYLNITRYNFKNIKLKKRDAS